MQRARAGLLLALGVLFLTIRVSTQTAPLRVVDAGPNGELNQLQEANEVRIIFSEPMVALGRIPSNPTLPWIRITPAMRGTYRWSGTTILLFTPDPATPLPHSTRYVVSIDAAAESALGHRLTSPFEFSFTTPSVKLTSLQWYRRQNRFDQPAVLLMRFNQPVQPAAVLAHTRVRFERHDVLTPEPTDRERTRLVATDPDGARRLDAKVAAAREVAARTTPVTVRTTTDWDRTKYPASDSLVVLETTATPPAGSWLRVTLDPSLPGVQGPATPGHDQTSVAELEPVFFALRFGCRAECNPSSYNGIQMTGDLKVDGFARALGVRNITQAPREVIVRATSQVSSTTLDTSSGPTLEDGGYDRQPPATTFAYRLDPSLAAIDGQTLGYPFIGVVENWHEPAFTSFGDGHGVWEVDGGPQLPFYSRNFADVRQWLSPLAPADLMSRIVELEKAGFDLLPPGTGTARRLTVTPDATQSYGIDLGGALSASGTGLVWAGLRPGTPIARSKRAIPEERSARSTLVQVTNLGINVKDSPQSTLVFVTRLDNGDAVADANVTIVNRENRQLWRGTTGRDGVVMAPALPLRDPEDWYRMSFIVMAEKGGDVAYVASDWNEGISPWDFGHPYQLWESTDILRGSIFTDRGVYKPGEDVHVKAIVRADTPTGIRLLPAGTTLDVRVRDSRGREVDKRTITLNRWSSGEWSWPVPADSTLGNYSLQVMMPGLERPEGNDVTPRARRQADWLKQVYGSFLVAAYRRPDFRVDATLRADEPIAGATLNGSVEARYLFGNAMRERPTHWSVTRSLTVELPDAILEKYPSDRYEFGYYPENRDRSEDRIAGADAKLDTAGRLTVTAPSTRDVDVAYRYQIEGDVEDVSRQHIANRASVLVHPAPWYIGLKRPAYFADTSTGTSVDVVAVALDGTPTPNIPVTLKLTRVQWNSVRRAEGSGFYTWDTEQVKVPAGEWTVTTAATPITQNIPVPEGGYYILSATARDAEGHQARTDAEFYGIGKGYTAWERYDHNRITLEPEKKTWKPGEKARLMIQSPWESATALLTVEREGVRSYQRFALTSTQQTVEVAISEDDIPNVYVSVLLVRGRTSKDPGPDGEDPGKPAFRLGYAELAVEDTAKKLSVSVAADREEYRPANVAHVNVDVKDNAGRATASEVTLWAVDYGVLSLTDYRAPDVLHQIYRDKALQVMNEDSRERIISRRVITPKGDGEGGGGGSDAGTFRRDFRPLAFWLGSVETDANGHATRDVTLPESLTTYRIMAVAADSASRFGSANAEIRVSKPVTLLAAFPRFLSLGDRATFGGVVTNTLNTPGGATITIKSLDPSLLQFQGSTSQTVQIAAGSTEPIRFDASARGVGTARVQMTVTLGRESDSFETTLPISAPAPIETSAAFGDTDSRTIEKLTLPASIVPGIGGLNVQLASTALVGLGEGARYLVDYPYGCAEQKSSAALALLLSADLGEAFQMGRIAPADYRARATALLHDLPRYQCSDGGFGYWPGGCLIGNVYLTSYVLHVMKVGESLGIALDDPVVGRALDFLDAHLKSDTRPQQVQWIPIWSASNAFSVKVLAEYTRNEDSNITRLMDGIGQMPVFALSYLADAIAASGTRGPRYDDVVRRLANALRIEGDRAHVEEVDNDALLWLWNTNVRGTAVVLEGFARRGDDPVFVQRLVRWLLLARTNGRWGNTQENATSLEALVGYYKKFEAEVPNMTATVSIGSRAIGTATFRGRTTTTNDVRLAMPDLLRQIPAGAERDLAFSRAGTGRLYYATRVQFAPTEPLGQMDQGIKIDRRYETYVENSDGVAGTTFAAGDLVRVTLTVTIPKERRYVAVTDALPAGLEPVDGWFRTTAADLASDASTQTADRSVWWFDRGGFDHVEKFDDRVQLFATRLAEGRHQFSYLTRATTTGTFKVAGTVAEEMYAPEVKGRAAPVTLVVR